MEYLIFTAGLAILLIGAEVMVRASVRLAAALGVSTFVIGLTVVAFGTSAPELVVSVIAAIQGKPTIALGNVIGSNIANVALVLGFAGLLFPLTLPRSSLRREVPLMIAASLAFFGFVCHEHGLSRIDGAILLVLFALFMIVVVKFGGKSYEEEAGEIAEDEPPRPGAWRKTAYLLLTFLGIAGLVGGAEMMVRSATAIAENLGVTESVIGMTIVAIGTSLPELAASAAAAIKKEPGLSIGNVIGSNVFNICLVMGVAGVIRPVPVPGDEAAIISVRIPIMIVCAAVLVPLFWGERKTGKTEAILLLAAYAVVMALLFFGRI